MKTLRLHYPGKEAASRWYRGRLYGRKLGTVESELAGVAEWVVDWWWLRWKVCVFGVVAELW